MSTGEDRQREAELLVAAAVGALIEFWGFRGVLGRVWTVLYLNGEPLPAADICERLGISTGAASMALNELERWGVVARKKVRGERKEFFAPETDVWRMVSQVFRERELVEIDHALAAFNRARELFDVQAQLGDLSQRRAARLAADRTATLIELAEVGRSLLSALVEKGRFDVGPLLTWARKRSP